MKIRAPPGPRTTSATCISSYSPVATCIYSYSPVSFLFWLVLTLSMVPFLYLPYLKTLNYGKFVCKVCQNQAEISASALRVNLLFALIFLAPWKALSVCSGLQMTSDFTRKVKTSTGYTKTTYCLCQLSFVFHLSTYKLCSSNPPPPPPPVPIPHLSPHSQISHELRFTEILLAFYTPGSCLDP